MLKTSKSMNIAGQSIIGNDIVVFLNANINAEGIANVNTTVQNKAKYEEHKTEVREDIEEFYDLIDKYSEEIVSNDAAIEN